jgi:HAD superfamily hydrolase (TIGR01484 family)
MMKPIAECPKSNFRFVFTDIDDTLTHHGQLPAPAYQALWDLSDAGYKVVPVTGRPAGWCEMIARFWPVAGIVGENGGLYFRYHNRKMHRVFFTGMEEQIENRKRLDIIAEDVLKNVPGSAIASDQFCRLLDLAIDFCEDVPALDESAVQTIVKIFAKHGAHAKVSSIHVNGWYGDYDKLTMCKEFLKQEFQLNLDQVKSECTFVGDSPNDEPMFAYFPISIAVANVKNFANKMKSLPTYVAPSEGSAGFVEIARHLLQSRQR